MVGKPMNLSYLLVGIYGLKIFEIRFGEKVHAVSTAYVKKRSDWEWLQVNGLWPDGVVFENGSNGKSNKKLILEQ